MLSTSITSNNYEIVGRMINILRLIRWTTDDRLLYKEASKLQFQLNNINNNYKLNWYDPMINPNLTLDLHNFFKYTHFWEKYFIDDFLQAKLQWAKDFDFAPVLRPSFEAKLQWAKDFDFAPVLRTSFESPESIVAEYSIDDVFEEIDDIALCLDKIMHIDYDKMRQDNRDFFVELNQYILKPDRVQKMSEQFNIDFFDYLDALDI